MLFRGDRAEGADPREPSGRGRSEGAERKWPIPTRRSGRSESRVEEGRSQRDGEEGANPMWPRGRGPIRGSGAEGADPRGRAEGGRSEGVRPKGPIQEAEMQRAHRDAWAATQTSKDAKQKTGELSSHQSRANRQQALGRGPVTCDCFFVAAASLSAESQSSQSQSASSSAVASGSARKSSELRLMCLLCRKSFNASGKTEHAKGKGHGTRWHAQVSSQSAASSSSSSSSSSLPQCDCK